MQKLKRGSAETEAVEASDSSDSEADTPATVQQLKQRKRGAKQALAIAAQGIPPVSRGEDVSALSASETAHLYMLPPMGGEDAVQRGAKPAVGNLRKTTMTALNKSPTPANTPERQADSRQRQDEGRGPGTAPRPAIAAPDPVGDITRHLDDAPAEYWDADLGEFRPAPTGRRSQTRLSRDCETTEGVAT